MPPSFSLWPIKILILYRPIFRALIDDLIFLLGNMPLVDELVFAKKSDPPNYTHCKKQKCDWGIIFKKPTGCDFTFPKDEELNPLEQFKHLQKSMETSQSLLDETQMKAIENFLENRVSLIQVIVYIYFPIVSPGHKHPMHMCPLFICFLEDKSRYLNDTHSSAFLRTVLLL